MSERAPAFGDLGDFAPSKTSARPDPRVIDEVAESQGFPSRTPRVQGRDNESATPPAPQPLRKPRRRTTGRNQQLNIKASAETITLMYSIADELQEPLGAVLELALSALARERSGDVPDQRQGRRS